MMPDHHIATYLNDHLAGSVVALELVESLESAHTGKPLAKFFSELKIDLRADRQQLELVMDQLGVFASTTRKAAAWLAEKVTQLKLRLDDPGGGALRLLEALEALSVGIEGKRLFWMALAAAGRPELQGTNYDRLTERAEDQRRRVEKVRLEAARAALGTLLPTPAGPAG
jgi:hypothetical protein